MGSDSDYLRENGFGFLLRGEIHRSWGEPEFSKDESLYFARFEDARQWSINSGGCVFTRHPDGVGYMPKQCH